MPEERLQKFLSNAGIASRRRAEDLIERGLVEVNGRKAKIGDKVDPSKDEIRYNGKIIKPAPQAIYIAVNKPKGYISSKRDPKGRRSVYDLLPKDLRTKLWSVGRLDFYTEGLMLFTNDGELTQQLSHPSFEHEKEYEVTLNRPLAEVPKAALDKLKKGVTVGEVDYHPAKLEVRGGKIYLTIHEGRKHQVRRMFESVGFKVANLKRIRLNRLKLEGIPLGKIKEVKKADII